MKENFRRRRIYFIEKKFQTNFMLKFSLLVILATLVFAGIVYLLSRKTSTVVFFQGKAKVFSTADFLFPILIQTAIVVTLAISFFVIILTLFVSHKIAGPLYRLKKELQNIGRGILPSNFCFRKKDQLQDLAEGLSLMAKELRERLGSLKKDWQELKEALGGFTREEIKDKIQKIDNSLEYFKID